MNKFKSVVSEAAAANTFKGSMARITFHILVFVKSKKVKRAIQGIGREMQKHFCLF